jgi:hypothetical protein
MTQYSNLNRGSIWKNKKKEKDTHPDFTGSLNVNGVEFWVNAWKRKDDAKPDAPSLSFTIRPKDGQPQQESAPRRPDPISTGRPRNADMNDDIPFAPEFR